MVGRLLQPETITGRRTAYNCIRAGHHYRRQAQRSQYDDKETGNACGLIQGGPWVYRTVRGSAGS